MMKEPPDFVGNILAKLMKRQLENPAISRMVKDWRMSVVFDTDYYPVSIIFDESIQIKTGFPEDPTLVFKLDFRTILLLVERKTTMIQAILRRKIRVKGFSHLKSLYRSYRLMNLILKG